MGVLELRCDARGEGMHAAVRTAPLRPDFVCDAARHSFVSFFCTTQSGIDASFFLHDVSSIFEVTFFCLTMRIL